MAHHTNTPKSVLDAPAPTAVQAPPAGANRSERRHGVVAPADLKPKALAKYLASLRRPNEPFVRTTPRRGKKVRRGGLA
ncbi:MAG: hypothetical protein HOU01_18285 [Streptomycetaceae bacterium]|nr:hypothetical protein [Streptomycetaceae bacterium]